MNRDEAARVEAFLAGRFPGADIRVSRIFGGLRIEIYEAGESFRADVADERSPVLAALEGRHPSPLSGDWGRNWAGGVPGVA